MKRNATPKHAAVTARDDRRDRRSGAARDGASSEAGTKGGNLGSRRTRKLRTRRQPFVL